MTERSHSDTIPEDAIAGAERVAGVAYTQAERAMLAETLAGQIAAAQRRRSAPLPDHVAPASRFDPRPAGFRPPRTEPFLPEIETGSALPSDDAAIAFAPVTRLAGWLADGSLTAERLAEIYLARIERLDPTLVAMARVTEDEALHQARRMDALRARGVSLGPLHGIPWGCKDILDTAGVVTDWGAEPFLGRTPTNDATVVRRITTAGGVMLGKTSVGALAYGDRWHGGRTRNPWNTEEGSTGSSAGSAAAVAAGLVGFALGTETLGSIVLPCHRCGTTGLRPTFGRVARTGAMRLCWTLDKIGPIARSVADCALVFAAIAGPDGRDPCAVPIPTGTARARPIDTLRVGWFPEDFDGPDVTDADRAAIATMRTLGVAMIELDRPSRPYDSLLAMLTAEAAANFEALTLEDRDDLLTWQAPEAWPNTFRRARFLSAVDHLQLDRLRSQTMHDMAHTFSEVDAIIGPCMAGPMLVISNFTGHPCLVMPCGRHHTPTRQPPSLSRLAEPALPARAGPPQAMPHAIALYGRLFDEARLMRLGAALEAALDANPGIPPGCG